MLYTNKHILYRGLLVAVVLSGGACSSKRVPPLTIADLMEDRVMLDGVLLKCNEDPAKARDNADCLNARIAIERLAQNVDPADEARRAAEFERSREKLRLAQEQQRREQEEKTKVDPYALPLMPVDATSPAAAAEATPTPPAASNASGRSGMVRTPP